MTRYKLNKNELGHDLAGSVPHAITLRVESVRFPLFSFSFSFSFVSNNSLQFLIR